MRVFLALLLSVACAALGANVFINEVQAKNASTIVDEYDEYDDWFELYNDGDEDVNIAGMWVADSHYGNGQDDWYQITDGGNLTTIPAGGFLLLWADDDTENEQGILHCPFKLSGTDDAVYLINENGAVADSIAWTYDEDTGLDVDDISLGRRPDGMNAWVFFGTGNEGDYGCSPGASNNAIAVNDDTVARQSCTISAYPNPFNPVTTIAWSQPEAGYARLCVYDVRGRLVRTLWQGQATSGEHNVVWDGRDNAGRPVASGIYFGDIYARTYTAITKMIILK